jgi:UDP-galactopyranose mutase
VRLFWRGSFGKIVEFDSFDLIMVGAGPTGCVIAERAARDMAWKGLVLEKRPHVAGNL